METSISDIVQEINAYAPDADVEPVMQAYLLAAQAHQGQGPEDRGHAGQHVAVHR